MHATQAYRLVAAYADGGAFLAIIMLAVLAEIGIAFAHNIAAVIARQTVPIVQADIGAVRVIGVQDIGNYRKEIAKSPVLKGIAYRRRSVTFA